jgi:nuclear-control-of-ATPase protein 2
LEEAIVGQLTVALYANALDKYLAQATQVEAEAEWWTDMENSTLALLLYLLQSMVFSLGLLVFLLADI